MLSFATVSQFFEIISFSFVWQSLSFVGKISGGVYCYLVVCLIVLFCSQNLSGLLYLLFQTVCSLFGSVSR